MRSTTARQPRTTSTRSSSTSNGRRWSGASSARKRATLLCVGDRHLIGAVATIDEAREALAGSPVDVIFVDVQLAATGDSRTGLDLIRSMAGEPLAPMFVLATASPEYSLEAFDLGVLDYILKPYTDERVDQCLRRLLERRKPRGQAVRRVVARRKKSLVFLGPEGRSIRAPVSQDRAKALRDVLLENATGLRRS